jgi:spore germination protein GerM
MRRSLPVPIAALFLAASLAACGDDDDRAGVYFVDGYTSDLGMRGHLVAQKRPVQEPGLGRIVAEVLRGPTAAQRDERGLITGFSPGVRVSTVALANGTARIRLSSQTPPQRWPDEFYATAQLVYTLTERADVQRVVLTVNGTRCCVYDMQQRPWMRPLTRGLFAHWQGAPVDE